MTTKTFATEAKDKHYCFLLNLAASIDWTQQRFDAKNKFLQGN